MQVVDLPLPPMLLSSLPFQLSLRATPVKDFSLVLTLGSQDTRVLLHENTFHTIHFHQLKSIPPPLLHARAETKATSSRQKGLRKG